MPTLTGTGLRIGQVAALTGATVPTIRFYEAQGLLKAAVRKDSGQRLYTQADVDRLHFIRRAREFDFPLPVIDRLLDLRDDSHCGCDGLFDFGKRQLTVVREKLAALTALEAELSKVVDDCQASCFGGAARDCVITLSLQRNAIDRKPA